MAFQQPQQRPQVTQRLSFPSPETSTENIQTSHATHRKRPLDDSEEWVLFSPLPDHPAQSDADRHDSTKRTPTTAGQSRLSDFGSVETLGRSERRDEVRKSCNVTSGVVSHGTDAEELDSLDDGLHAFHEPPDFVEHSHVPVLPTHDGFGLFQARSNAVQEQLWQFERQNQRQVLDARRSSLQAGLDAMNDNCNELQESDARVRVERWRLEQSKTLLEEIGRESRKLRRWSNTRSRPTFDRTSGSSVKRGSAVLTPSDSQNKSMLKKGSESLIQRFTRRVIRDLIGLDAETLAFIFGEDYLREVSNDDTSAAIPSGHDTYAVQESRPFGSQPWQHRLLERIARELGTLVHQLTQHPGAFSTYQRTLEPPPYVGVTSSEATIHTLIADNPEEHSKEEADTSSQTSPHFSPTLSKPTAAPTHDTSIWGIEETPLDPNTPYNNNNDPEDEANAIRQEREYWERELDVKMIFDFLCNRFASRNSSPARTPTTTAATTRNRPTAQAAAQTPLRKNRTAAYVPAHRAALVQQQHPLASRSRREMLLRQAYRPAPAVQRCQAETSSCASQSTRKSRKTNSTSRKYWDLGGSSIGSGPTASVGTWGEV